MMTTANAFRPGDPPRQPVVSTVAERMAKMRAAKVAKAEARKKEPYKEVYDFAKTDMPKYVEPVADNASELESILRELGTMIGYHNPRGKELIEKAKAILGANP